MFKYLCDVSLLVVLEYTIICTTLTLCYPACAHHRKTLKIRLLAVGFNNLDGRSGLFRPAPLQCRPAAFMQQVCSGVGDTGTGSGNTRTGSRAVATANMAGYCTGTRACA